MDRAVNSLANRCSCSCRPLSDQAQPCYRKSTPKRLYYRHHTFHNKNHQKYVSDHGRRRYYVVTRSQSPKQQPGGSPEAGLPPAEQRVIASLVASGLSGTLAILGAGLARIDLFGQFRWSSLDDLSLALTLASGVTLLEAALFGPRYDILLAGAGRPGARPGAVGLQLRTAHVGELLSADSVVATLVLQQACFVAAQIVRGRYSTPPPLPETQQSPSPPPSAQAAPSSSSSSTSTSPQAPLPSYGTPSAVEVGLILVRESAKEVLQRGFLFTLLAAWITDRSFEAGADDTITLAGLAGGTEVYLTDAVRFGTAALLTGLMIPPVANEAEALRLGVASNLALVMTSQLEEGEAKERKAEGERGGEGEGRKGGVSYDEGADDQETDALLREYRLIEALGRTPSTGPPRLTFALTLLRGLLRFGSVNLAFALTGNLAATLAASALPNLLLLAYVRGGPKVLLERPAPAGAQGGREGGGDPVSGGEVGAGSGSGSGVGGQAGGAGGAAREDADAEAHKGDDSR